MEKKKGLNEFLKVYDIAGETGWSALDLAQNLSFKYEFAKPEYNKVEENDVRLAYETVGNGLMQAIHNLAEALGYTRGDYIEGADKRRGRGNCNIYIVGQGSISCNVEGLIK